MRLLLSIAACLLLLCSVGVAQNYDANGNLPSEIGQIVPPGTRAPGDIVNRIYGPLTPQTGLARMDAASNELLMISGYDGTSTCYILDDTTGSTITTVNLSAGTTGDFEVGYDTSRSLFITTNASSDVVKTFNATGGLVSTFTAPGAGPVGVAYDATRDVYWICDWQSNMVTSMNPTTGSPVQSWSVSGSRLAGVAYCPKDDILFVGARDQAMIYALDAATGTPIGSWAAQGSNNNVCGLTHKDATGTVWEAQYESNEITEFEGYCGGGPSVPTVDIKCNGGDAAVMVPAGTNAKLDFDIVAASAAGTPVDIWIALITPFGPFSYNGIGPISGWNFGLGSAYFTGPLGDVTGTALDRPLPVGNYKAHCGLDTVPNGSLDLGAVVLSDMVDFRVF